MRRTCSWKFKGKRYSFRFDISNALYEYYKNTPRLDKEDYSVYVFEAQHNKIIKKAVSYFKRVKKRENFSDLELVNFVLALVQSLTYRTEIGEYPIYPIETIVEKGGDCEDLAILTATFYYTLGFKVALLRLPKHMAVGIAVDDASGTYVEHDGKKYYYGETTGERWKLGEVPDELRRQSITIHLVVPKAVISHHFTARQTHANATVRVRVKNIGTRKASKLKVRVAFDAGRNRVYNPKESRKFSLAPEQEKKIILKNVEFPQDVRTRYLVKIIQNSKVLDESYSQWFAT